MGHYNYIYEGKFFCHIREKIRCAATARDPPLHVLDLKYFLVGKQENLRNDYMISAMIQNPISYFFAESQKRNFWYFTKGPPVRS